MMKLWRQDHLRDSIRPERVSAVMDFGFSEPQARFLLHVLIFSGVFIERQYRACTGVSHGQRTKDFLASFLTGATQPRSRPDGCTAVGSSTSTTSRSTRPSARAITVIGGQPRRDGSSSV